MHHADRIRPVESYAPVVHPAATNTLMAIAAAAPAATAWGAGFGLAYWGAAFALICVLLFVCVYPLFVLTDLEADMINPIDACHKLNKMAKHEFVVQV